MFYFNKLLIRFSNTVVLIVILTNNIFLLREKCEREKNKYMNIKKY